LPDEGRLLAAIALFDLGHKAGALEESPFGTNMAFTKAMFTRHGGFRTDIGPNPENEIRGEDSEFANRLLAAGERLWYEPSAIVYHPVPQDRLQKQYFQTWWFDKGRSDVRACGIASDVKLVLAGVPLRLLRRFAVWTARWVLTLPRSRRFSHKLTVWLLAGKILEYYGQAHPTRRQVR
jgi:GT2 family glycosyltransferase